MGGFAIWRSIPLTQGKVTWVDQADYEMLSQFQWHAQRRRQAFYAVISANQRTRLMHRFLLLPDPEQDVDHVNGDGLDNRRRNLRVCTTRENQRNAHKPRGGTSWHKGVSWHKRGQRWQSQIQDCGKIYYLGWFRDEVDAALAYDLAALERFGEFAAPNFLRRQ